MNTRNINLKKQTALSAAFAFVAMMVGCAKGPDTHERRYYDTTVGTQTTGADANAKTGSTVETVSAESDEEQLPPVVVSDGEISASSTTAATEAPVTTAPPVVTEAPVTTAPPVVTEAPVVEVPSATTPVVSAPAVEKTPAELLEACSQAALKSKTFRLNFPERQGCTWEKNKADGKMRGRFGQTIEAAVQSNWVLCSMDINVSKGKVTYDDNILIHFNDATLIATKGIINLLGENSEGLSLYDWNKLKGQSLDPNGRKCMTGAVTCELTGSQDKGPIVLSLNAGANKKLMKRAMSLNKYKFGVVTTGDSDTKKDCRHTGIPLDVTITYYKK
jgi:hypothetical protein